MPLPIAEPPAPTVRELLDLSRAAHQRYREALPQRRQDGTVLPGDSTLARAALLDARRLRQQAEQDDPAFADAAWSDSVSMEPDTKNANVAVKPSPSATSAPADHVDLLAFYEAQLGK